MNGTDKSGATASLVRQRLRHGRCTERAQVTLESATRRSLRPPLQPEESRVPVTRPSIRGPLLQTTRTAQVGGLVRRGYHLHLSDSKRVAVFLATVRPSFSHPHCPSRRSLNAHVNTLCDGGTLATSTVYPPAPPPCVAVRLNDARQVPWIETPSCHLYCSLGCVVDGYWIPCESSILEFHFEVVNREMSSCDVSRRVYIRDRLAESFGNSIKPWTYPLTKPPSRAQTNRRVYHRCYDGRVL